MLNFGRLPLTLTLLPTYRCTSSCENCCFHCNSTLKDELSLEQMTHYIKQAVDSFRNLKVLVLSGGECFLLGDKLEKVIGYGANKGLVTRCVTNGYWAKDYGHAVKRLSLLKKNGLQELNISTGDIHQKFVPIKNVINGTIAALDLGLRMVVVIERIRNANFTKKEFLSIDQIKNVTQDKKKAKLFKVIENPWVPISEEENILQGKMDKLSKENLQSRGGCNSIFSAIGITPTGDLGACCGLTREEIPELRLGSLNESNMKVLFEEGLGDFLKLWLFVEGPEKIIDWASKKDSQIEWEHKYSHHCEVCRAIYTDNRIRSVIKKYYKEKLHNILFRFTMFNKFGRFSRSDENLYYV